MLDSTSKATPKPFEPVLAEIEYQERSSYFRVIFYDGEDWRHYANNDNPDELNWYSFETGEIIIRWIYAREAFNIAKAVNK